MWIPVPESAGALVPRLRPAFLSGLTLIKRQDLLMAPTYKTFQDEESLLNLTLPRKAPNLGPFKSIKVVDPSVIYLKDGSGATLVELDVELKAD